MAMYQELYQALRKEISGENAFNMAAEIWRHDCTCSFAEYAKSARYCQNMLEEYGASETEIITFPATGRAKYGAYRIQRAWDGNDAELHIVEPAAQAKRLVSYRDNPYVLCSGSPPTPKGGVEAEVVILKGGDKETHYKRTDVKGKVILTSSAPSAVHKLAAKHGAVGIISDIMATNPVVRPTPMDLPDAHLWMTLRPEGKLFAFVLSPREGKELRELIGAQKKKRKPVRMRAVVDTKVYDGNHEMVSACIKGSRTDQEVALVAHLYEPGANDNASGVAVLLEIVRSLKALIRAGKLKRPYRTIRIWLVHEFQSLMALTYERPEEIERVIAAANVDFVGQDQGLSGSHLMYQTCPDALPHFVDHLMIDLMDYFRKSFYTWGNDTSSERYFATMQTPFWMNDNFISDPSVGIPSVAFIQWPDKFYHTDHDTPDKLMPDSLARVAAVAGSLIYTIADARLPEALQFCEIVSDRAGEFLRQAVDKQIAKARALVEKPEDEKGKAKKSKPDLSKEFAELWRETVEKIDYVRDRQLIALDSLGELLADKEQATAAGSLAKAREEIAATAEVWQQRAGRRLAAFAKAHDLGVAEPAKVKPPTQSEKRAAKIVPYRKTRGIVTNGELPKKSQKALEKVSKAGLPRLLLYWIDGERSLLEVCRLANLEGDGKPLEPARAIRWAETMKEAGVLGLKQAAKGK